MKVPTSFESVLLAELNIGLPPTSFHKLLAEPDDWSFILKLHAILECALVRLLEKRSSNEFLDENSNFVQKVNSAFELPEVAPDKEYQDFYFALNYVRNRFAHNAKYICADLETVIRDIPGKRRRWVLQSLGLSSIDQDRDRIFNWFAERFDFDQAKLKTAREKFRRDYPKSLLFVSGENALHTLSIAYYIQLGKDGKYYAEEFRPQLQDLLHDPAVIELRRSYESDFPNAGLTSETDE